MGFSTLFKLREGQAVTAEPVIIHSANAVPALAPASHFAAAAHLLHT